MAEPEDKGPLEKPIDWFSNWKASFERIRQRFGLPVAVLLFLSVAGGLVWWNWDDIVKRPGVGSLLARFNQKALPSAPAGRLTIAVADLEGDKEQEEEKLLLDGLRDFEGVETLALHRMVAWPDSGTEQEKKKEAEKKARSLLKQTGADVLIWGSVISLGGKSAMRLYWTPSREVSGAKQSEKYLPQTETLALPELFWSDLKQILGLLTETRLAELTDEPGQFVADKLAPLIAQVRSLVENKQGDWNPEILAGVRFSLAGALGDQGEQSGKNEPLLESVELYHKVLDQWTRASKPLDWTMAQNNLGIVLWALGERENGTARLEAAAAAFREALKEETREINPVQWAMTQNNLGAVLLTIGMRGGEPAKFEKSAAAFRDALRVLTRERDPQLWGMAQNNLGLALWVLGARESGTALLEQSAAAFREALKELTRERDPHLWAMAQNNLGIVLSQLGDRSSGPTQLEDAATAFRLSLKELTRERAPYQWATAQNNLGTVLRTLAERTGEARPLEGSIAAYQEALKEFTRESNPRQWAIAKTNLGLTMKMLGERSGGEATLNGAAAAFREASQVNNRELAPLAWAQAQLNLVSIYVDLFALNRKPELLNDALQAVEGALEEYRKAGMASETGKTETVRSQILALRAQLESAPSQESAAPPEPGPQPHPDNLLSPPD